MLFSGVASIGYPGAAWQVPKLHHSPDCLHHRGWHDVAAALTVGGVHHVFQGCPEAGGWSHASSKDLVHWKDLGLGPVAVNETYAGMQSMESPCSGFIAVDDAGTPCAGFRQCGSTRGTTELNPAAHPWDVPMEVRCAQDEELTEWGPPQWLNPIYYYRALPYDPVRPWKDFDGKWYYGLSTDGCNSTTRRVPCTAGGRLELFTADRFDGPWTQLAPLFTTNTTMSGRAVDHSCTGEFVTSDYFGALPGDPDGGKTRVLTQNRVGPTFWVGQQSNGGPFTAYWGKRGAIGHYDYGDLTMARTLGGDPNQVAVGGRKVLIGWIGGGKYRTPASQSLARDLSLSAGYELLQTFVPELEALRGVGTHTTAVGRIAAASMQLEIFATFSIPSTASLPAVAAFGVDVLAAMDGSSAVSLLVDCSALADADADCHVVVDATGQGGKVYKAPLLYGAGDNGTVSMHAIVDHSIIELIVNNRTAIVAYAYPPTDQHSGVRLFGTEVQAKLDYWPLRGI